MRECNVDMGSSELCDVILDRLYAADTLLESMASKYTNINNSTQPSTSPSSGSIPQINPSQTKLVAICSWTNYFMYNSRPALSYQPAIIAALLFSQVNEFDLYWGAVSFTNRTGELGKRLFTTRSGVIVFCFFSKWAREESESSENKKVVLANKFEERRIEKMIFLFTLSFEAERFFCSSASCSSCFFLVLETLRSQKNFFFAYSGDKIQFFK